MRFEDHYRLNLTNSLHQKLERDGGQIPLHEDFIAQAFRAERSPLLWCNIRVLNHTGTTPVILKLPFILSLIRSAAEACGIKSTGATH